MENIYVLEVSNESDLETFLLAMTTIHIDCITNDNTIATFLPPLSKHQMMEYYKNKTSDVSTGKCSIIMEWVPIKTRVQLPTQDAALWNGRELSGFVMLNRTPSQTGPHRASVEKLLVSSKYRKRGVARRLMVRLEEEARRTSSWLLVRLFTMMLNSSAHMILMLDTTIGSGAEFVYPKLGYTSLGIIPHYSISPRDNKTFDDEM